MSISAQLFAHVESLQAGAESSYGNPEDSCVLPNDAVYLTRVSNLQTVCTLIEELVAKSGLPLSTVLTKSIQPHLGELCKAYMFTEDALLAIIRDFT